MNKFTLPKEIIEEFKSTGVLSIGGGHGITEHYEIYNNIINQLEIKPNIAIELGFEEKTQFENFKESKKVDPSAIYADPYNEGKLIGDGRATVECFNFLKKYSDQNPNIKIIFLDENITSFENRDNEQAQHFLKNIEKPILIIAGNLHASKEIKEFDGKKFTPMGYFIKEKVGDFPYIDTQPASGSYYNGKIRNITPDSAIVVNKFIKTGENSYKYYFEKATPTTQFE